MSRRYLSHIRIQDFRTFGGFDVELPAAPGLTLLTGTNGLGKSSFFDAIEWGLTGGIRRFDSYLEKRKKIVEGDYLTRRGAAPGSHSVELGFSEGAPLLRSADAVPSQQDIIALLARSDWGPINDVATYLAFTHFLGQAAQQRFTSRKPDEQWEALKGPSGIERLEQIRRGLRGRPTQIAFTKRIDTEAAQVADLQRRIAEWSDARERRTRLQEAAQDSGLLDAERFAAELRALGDHVLQLGDDTLDLTADTATLIGLSGALASIRAGRTALARNLDSLAPLPEQWAVLAASAAANTPAVEAARQALASARAALATAEAQESAARTAAQGIAASIAFGERSIATLEAARKDIVRIPELDQEIDAASAAVATLDGQLGAARTGRSDADTRIQQRGKAEDACAQARTVAETARETLARARTIADAEAVRARSEAEHARAQEAARLARAERIRLSAEQVALTQAQAGIEARLVALRAQASEIAAAVASIAGHLQDDDTECPVCHSDFAPGQLRLLARAASTGNAAGLADAERSLQQTRDHLTALVERIAVLDKALAQESLTRVALEQSRLALGDIRAGVAALLGCRADADLTALAEARDKAAAQALASVEAALEAAVSAAAGADALRETLEAELQTLAVRRDSEAERIARLTAERQACRDRVAATGHGDLFAIDEQLTGLRTESAKLGKERDSQAVKVAEATAACAQARSQLGGIERAQSEAEAARTAAKRALAALETRWEDAGLALPPSAAMLETARTRVASDLAALDTADARREVLVKASEANLLRDEIAALEAQMTKIGGAAALADPGQHAAALTEALAKARAAHRLSMSARTALNKFTNKLKAEAEDFSSKVLAPLNEVIDAFNESMLSTPGETIRFSADHRVDATRFDMTLRYKDRIDDATLHTELPPQIVLSEGQLAANGFSILCAASTAYPWSNWRALLLDDPLQHNDIIHTAAFVDVMRNLVEFESYQLLMSSHDRAETEFIARKFEAAGLPCTKIVLTAPSADGVRYEGPTYNRAAQAELFDQRETGRDIASAST